jgi:hypothetical protein
MPGSIPNPIPLIIVKVAGYTVAGILLNRTFKKGVFPVLIGIVRTIAGLLLGLLTIVLAAVISPIIWYVVLRIGVWYLLIYYFYERKGITDPTFRIGLLAGVACSFAIDGILYLLSSIFPDIMLIPWC